MFLVGTLFATTACNNDKSNAPQGKYPTAAEIIGTWRFVDTPPELASVLHAMNGEEILLTFEANGDASVSSNGMRYEWGYTYSEANGQMILDILLATMAPFSVTATVTRTTKSNQLLFTYTPEGAQIPVSVRLERVGSSPQPEDPTENVYPSKATMISTYWRFVDVPEELQSMFIIPGSTQTEVYLRLLQDGTAFIGNPERYFEWNYSYTESDGKLTVYVTFEDGELQHEVSVLVTETANPNQIHCTYLQPGASSPITITLEKSAAPV